MELGATQQGHRELGAREVTLPQSPQARFVGSRTLRLLSNAPAVQKGPLRGGPQADRSLSSEDVGK